MRLGLVAHPYPGCQVLIVSVKERNTLINLLTGISDGGRYAVGVVSHVYLGARSRHWKPVGGVEWKAHRQI